MPYVDVPSKQIVIPVNDVVRYPFSESIAARGSVECEELSHVGIAPYVLVMPAEADVSPGRRPHPFPYVLHDFRMRLLEL